MARSCIFCGVAITAANRAREHIFPDHILQHFGLRDSTLEYSDFGSAEAGFTGGNLHLNTAKRSLTYNGFLAGKVCFGCNSGWMSALEVAVQPFLYGLMAGSHTPQSLTQAERQALGFWTVKTVLALESAIPPKVQKIPLQHANEVYENRNSLAVAPAGINVLAGIGARTPGPALKWAKSVTFIFETPEGATEEVMAIYQGAYKFFLQLDQLLLLAVYVPRGLTLLHNPTIHCPVMLSRTLAPIEASFDCATDDHTTIFIMDAGIRVT